MILEEIGEDENALKCLTNQPYCCRSPFVGDAQLVRGRWLFPNETVVPSSDGGWDFHRTRGNMSVLLHRRRGGEEGVYRCDIPDELNMTQSIYITVYREGAGE